MHTRIAAAALFALSLTACPEDVAKIRDIGSTEASPQPAVDPNVTPAPTFTLTPVGTPTPVATATPADH